MEEKRVVIIWKVDDILKQKPEWTREEASNFLDSIEEELMDRSIEAGWNVVDWALAEEEMDSYSHEHEG